MQEVGWWPIRTIVELEVPQTLLKRRGSKTTGRGGGTLGGAGGQRNGCKQLCLGELVSSIQVVTSQLPNQTIIPKSEKYGLRCASWSPSKSRSPWPSWQSSSTSTPRKEVLLPEEFWQLKQTWRPRQLWSGGSQGSSCLELCWLLEGRCKPGKEGHGRD